VKEPNEVNFKKCRKIGRPVKNNNPKFVASGSFVVESGVRNRLVADGDGPGHVVHGQRQRRLLRKVKPGTRGYEF
jgi:hypothetical protein